MNHHKDENSNQTSKLQKPGVMILQWLLKFVNHNNHLTIQRKILFGYIIALLIVMFGGLLPIIIADYFQAQANEYRIRVRRERKLLGDLRADTLSLLTITSFPSSLQKPKSFQQAKATALTRVTQSKQLFTKLNQKSQKSSNQILEHLFAKYKENYLEYLQELETLLNRTENRLLERQMFRVKESFANLYSSNDTEKTQEFIHQLGNVIEITEKQEEIAEDDLSRAQLIRIIIIIIGINITIVLSYLFIRYLSHEIASPITDIIKITKQASSQAKTKSNFDCKISVNQDNDTSQLANCINNLLNQLQTLVEEQKKAQASLDGANQAKSKFLASMSHELRTPLNGILGYAQILANSQNLTEEQKHGIKTIYECGFHLLNLINDILDLSKMEARKMELQFVDIHLPSFLQGVVEICRIKAEQKGIDFVYDSPPNLPAGISIDKKRLRQVLINLLTNAIKFTDTGCVKLQVKFAESKPNYVKLNFAVVDTGVGMNTNQIKMIFSPFEQVVNNDRPNEGNGLGLTISQKIVEMMGSNIQVKSQVGVGTLFEFELESRLAEDWTESSTITSRGKIIGYSGPEKKILIVDDSWENRSLFISLLEPLGFAVIEASNGKEGIDRANQYHPDMIISDVTMPIMNGWEMLAKMRQSELFQDTVIIIASPNVYEIDRQKTLLSGADGFLTRPVQPEELYNMLTKHLKINWTYAAPPVESSSEAVTVFTSAMVIPPVSDLTLLLEYARKGQIKGIKQELEKIAIMDEKYHIFVRQLNKYAKNLNIQKIRNFIQEYIRN
ncbi:MAG: response regulator [Calothrix sp. FI2-JRJ7]|jgi:signal transduction histidine kinase/DNA-binding NarL/FixJ family response regulator|nr:response regulator [Calothrix sp. FI2-JRJ7]